MPQRRRPPAVAAVLAMIVVQEVTLASAAALVVVALSSLHHQRRSLVAVAAPPARSYRWPRRYRCRRKMPSQSWKRSSCRVRRPGTVNRSWIALASYRRWPYRVKRGVEVVEAVRTVPDRH
uniref:Putative secreted peptide n=1 Tax=Anopheles braziliensis TaxID=58242 RepID=A0A2M3ZW17_9DIPT